MTAKTIETFSVRARGRVGNRFGFNWQTIMQIVMEVLQGCLNDQRALQSFTDGNRDRGQLAALTHIGQQQCRAAGVFFWRRAGNLAAEAILEELNDVKAAQDGRMGSDGTTVPEYSGDVYGAVFAELEAMRV